MSALKKIRSFLLLSFLFPLTLWAAETDYTWTLSGSLGGPGSTGEIYLAVENAVDISSFGIEVRYNTGVLEPFDSDPFGINNNFAKLNRAEGKTLLGSFPDGNIEIYRLAFIAFDVAGNIQAGSGDILKFLFKVREDAAIGDTATVWVTVALTETVLASITLEVTEAAGPEFIELTPQVGNVLDTLRFTVEVVDPTAEGLKYRMETPPGPDAALDSLTGEFKWFPAAAGSFPAKFSVTDASELSDSLTVEIIINTPPVFEDPGPQAVNVGETLQFTLVATDEDEGASLIYRKSEGAPAAMALDSLTGEVTWTSDQAGTYEVGFIVTDSFAVDSLTVQIKVNTPPVLADPGPLSGLTGQQLAVALEATDGDGDDLLYRLLGSPGPDAAVDSLTGEFTWVPSEVGVFAAKFGVTDGVAWDSLSVEITVEMGVLPLAIVYPEDGATFNVTEGKAFKLVFLINNQAESLFVHTVGLPETAAFVADTVLQWTPGQADAGQYPVSVIYSNETGGADTVDITISVMGVNAKPVWTVVADTLRAKEGEAFSYTFAPPVDYDPDDVVFVSISNPPPGAEFNAVELSLTWVPGYDKAGVYQFGLVATDLAGARRIQLVTLVVKNTNRVPQILLVEEVLETNEGELLSFSVLTYDADGDQVVVEAQNLPEGVIFLDPAFTWTDPVEGQYPVTFVASDLTLADTFELTITVIGVNDPPVFDLVPDVSVEAGVPMTIELSATDPDEDVLTYSLMVTGEDDILSRGATFVGKTLNWTPSATDIGPNIVTFMVKDPKGLKDYLEVTITVTGRNIQLPPEFKVAFYKTWQVIEEEEDLVVELAQTLTNPEQEDLEFWVDNLPEGAEFDEVTATITWTPTLLQAGIYEVLCGVSDGNFPDIKILYIEVTDKDVVPVLNPVGDRTIQEKKLLKIKLAEEDVDASGEPITFDADGLPEGAEIFKKGSFKFHPDWDQAGTYQITFYVFDASGNSDEETITLTVLDKNRKPKMVAENQVVAEGGTLQFNVAATDLDGDEVSYSAYDLPEGATFDEETGLFDWTPTQEQSGNYVVLFTASDSKEGGVDSVRVVITVGDVNRPPEIDPVGDQVVAEGSSLSFEITASDPDEGDQLTIELSGMPEGATLTYDPGNPVTATVELTPGYLDAEVYEVLVTVNDNNPEDAQSVSRSFQLEVTDTDVAPVFTGQLAGPGVLELSVDEGGLLEIEVTAVDQGGDALSYSTSTLPRNAWSDFTGARKLVSFAPDYTQSGPRQFEIIVSDGAKTVRKTVKVTVNEVNLPPVVFQIEDQSVEEGDIITFAVDYRDPDGDSATVFLDKTRVPFLTQGDPAPASIRDGKVFVFDTALLPPDVQISSAVFYFWAEDVRGGVSDTVRVEIAVVRSGSTEVVVPAGTTGALLAAQEQEFTPEGFGLLARFINNTGQNMTWQFDFLEKSGFLELAGLPGLASAEGGKLKADKGVYTYLAGDDLTSQFYGIRRGWGLDLSAQEQVEGADVVIILSYFDEDLPTEVPNFTEERLSVFGYDPNLGEWVEIEGVTVDTEANQATFTITDYSIVDYTIGAEVDVVAPVITDLKVVAGSYTVVATGVDTTYDLAGPYEFRVNITDDEILSGTEAKFYYSLDGVSFEEVELERLSGNLFTAQVSGPMVSGSTILYYVTAQDEMNVVSSPSGAPEEVYELVVVEYTALPGDVDQSGSINIFDLLDLLQVLSGSKPSSLGSDVNQDGLTNIFDLLALLSILAG